MLYVGAKALKIEQMQGSSEPLSLSDAISTKIIFFASIIHNRFVVILLPQCFFKDFIGLS